MDNLNKIISFVLGLVVVVVFFAIVTGKINLKSKTTTLASKSDQTSIKTQKNNDGFFGFFKTKSPTPTPKIISSITGNTSVNEIYEQNPQAKTFSNAKSIPSAGLPTFFIPMLISGLAGGGFLRKFGKN